MQDNGGAADNGVVDASETWRLLIEAITRAGGPLYEYRQIDPVNNADGGAQARTSASGSSSAPIAA